MSPDKCILPHALIAVNAADPRVDQQEWNPEFATNMFMSSVESAVRQDPYFREVRDYWVARGRHIHTMRDLLQCYYSTVTVVRVPDQRRPMLLDGQIKKLYQILRQRCAG